MAQAMEPDAVKPNAAKQDVFSVMEYQIAGNTKLPVIRIEEAVYPYLGEGKSIADVEKARAALEKAYHDSGYLTVLVDIPEQSVSNGIVELKVTEGTVEKIRVVDSHYFSRNRILSKVPELAEGSVPYFPEVQKELVDANSAADLRVTPILRPGSTPGKVEAELKAEDQLPFHASVELNNYASANTSPLRLTGMVRYDNLWQREHSLSLQYQTSPQQVDEVKVFSGTYLMPIENSDNKLAYYAVASRSNVATVGDLSVLGRGNIVGARWVIPLPSREKLSHSLTLGVDYKDFMNDTLLAGANTGHTPIHYLPFSAAYGASMPDEAGVSAANATLNFHFRGVGDRMMLCSGQVVSEFECARWDAKPDYFYLRGGIERTQILPRGLALFARLDGQIASGPLVSNEQFTAGGADSVRGYYESEQVGDDGARGTLELRGPQMARGKFSDLRPVMFLEGAHLRVREPLPAQTDAFSLASAGFGLRALAGKGFTMRFDAAWPLKSTSYTEAGKARFGFKAVAAF
jgi:hemolysin activation/secretion protein